MGGRGERTAMGGITTPPQRRQLNAQLHTHTLAEWWDVKEGLEAIRQEWIPASASGTRLK